MHGIIQFLRISLLPLLWASLAILVITAMGWWFPDVTRGSLIAFGTFGILLSIVFGGLYVLRNCWRVRYPLWRTFAAIMVFFTFAAFGFWMFYAHSEMQLNGRTLIWVMVPELLISGVMVMVLPVFLLSLIFVIPYGVAKRFRKL